MPTPSRVALGLFAHPDDETLACGGTLAALAGDGWDVHVVYLGDGKITARGGLQDNQADAVAACTALGLGEPTFAGYPDQRLDTVAIADLANAARDAAPAPDLVLTTSPADVNEDHRIAAQVARVVARPIDRPVGLLEGVILGAEAWSGLAAAPNWWCDISATLERKLAALACYEAEARSWPHPRSPEAVEAQARATGAAHGMTAAEAFTLVHGARGHLP